MAINHQISSFPQPNVHMEKLTKLFLNFLPEQQSDRLHSINSTLLDYF